MVCLSAATTCKKRKKNEKDQGRFTLFFLQLLLFLCIADIDTGIPLEPLYGWSKSTRFGPVVFLTILIGVFWVVLCMFFSSYLQSVHEELRGESDGML